MKFLIFAIYTFITGQSLASSQSELSSFKKTISELNRNSVGIRAQALTVESYETSLNSAKLFWTPSVSAELQETRTSISSSLNLYKFNGSLLGLNAAKAKLNAEKDRMLAEVQTVEKDNSDLIFRIIRQSKIVEINQQNFRLKEDSLNLAKERYRQGQLAIQEMEKFKVEVENSRVTWQVSKLELIKLIDVWKVLSSEIRPLPVWPYLEKVKERQLNKLSDAKDLPSVRAIFFDAEYYLNKSKETWRSGILPSLDWTASWGATNSNGRIGAGTWSTSLVLTIPLWDRLSSSSVSGIESALGQGAQLKYNFSKRTAEVRLQSLPDRLEILKSNVIVAQQGVIQLKSLRDGMARRFRLGRASVNDLLVDEGRFLEAELNLQSTLYAYHVGMVELCHSSGESLENCF